MPKTFLGKDQKNLQLKTENFQSPNSLTRKLGNQKTLIAKKMVNVHLHGRN
jgi:biotin operon repressor